MERILFNKTGEGSDGSLGGVDCSFVNANLEQSVNLYRMDKDENIEQLVGDADRAMFPNGGISGIGSGFGLTRTSISGVWKCTMASCTSAPLIRAACWSPSASSPTAILSA